MAQLKRQFVSHLLDARKQRKICGTTLQREDEFKEPLRMLKPPELVKMRLGTPTAILGFDVETHDWIHENKVARIGDFHWFTKTNSAVIKRSRIVELGWVYAEPGAQLSKKTKRVIPNGWTVSQQAYDFHKISTEDAQKGEPLQDILSEFLKDVRSICQQGGRICAHNFEFDAGIIWEELGRCGSEDLKDEWFETARTKGYCTMNPEVGRWIWQCMGRGVGALDSKWTKGLHLLLKLLAPHREDLFLTSCHKAVVDAEGSRLLYMTLLDHALTSDDDTQPYVPDMTLPPENMGRAAPSSPKTARRQWEVRFAKTMPMQGIVDPVV